MKIQKQLFLHYPNKIAILILFLIFLYGCHFTNGQQNKMNDCLFLKKSVETEAFKEQFYINLDIDDTIIIVDTTNFFYCISSEFEINGRKVQINNILDRSKKHIQINKIKQNQDKITIYFYQPINLNSLEMNGPTFWIEMKYNKNEIQIIDYGKGAI